MFLAIGFGVLLLLIVGTVVSMIGGDECSEFSKRFGGCIPRQVGPVGEPESGLGNLPATQDPSR